MSTARTLVIWLFVVAFLGSRLAGLHLHLCFDGTEPAVSVQSQTHDVGNALGDLGQAEWIMPMDIDIDLFGQALNKIEKASLDLPMLLVAVSLLFLATRPNLPRAPLGRVLLVPPLWPHIRPPLRAPPR